MKKIMKKNQVIITSLAILIAVAGYLNFADVDLGFQDKEASADSSSILDEVDYDLTDETALLDENGANGETPEIQDTSTPGEAVLTGASNFAAQAKLSREQVRSRNKADLQEIINNADIGEDKKQEAINTMVSMTELAEKEAAAEMLLEAKGFENVVVNLTGETADVVVPDSELEDAKRAQIEDIVKRKTGIAADKVVITPLSESEDPDGTTEQDLSVGTNAAADETEPTASTGTADETEPTVSTGTADKTEPTASIGASTGTADKTEPTASTETATGITAETSTDATSDSSAAQTYEDEPTSDSQDDTQETSTTSANPDDYPIQTEGIYD